MSLHGNAALPLIYRQPVCRRAWKERTRTKFSTSKKPLRLIFRWRAVQQEVRTTPITWVTSAMVAATAIARRHAWLRSSSREWKIHHDEQNLGLSLCSIEWVMWRGGEIQRPRWQYSVVCSTSAVYSVCVCVQYNTSVVYIFCVCTVQYKCSVYTVCVCVQYTVQV